MHLHYVKVWFKRGQKTIKDGGISKILKLIVIYAVWKMAYDILCCTTQQYKYTNQLIKFSFFVCVIKADARIMNSTVWSTQKRDQNYPGIIIVNLRWEWTYYGNRQQQDSSKSLLSSWSVNLDVIKYMWRLSIFKIDIWRYLL